MGIQGTYLCEKDWMIKEVRDFLVFGLKVFLFSLIMGLIFFARY